MRITAGYKNEIQQLERRLAKLSQALQETESELHQVSHELEVDHGVASAYRVVQGLDPGETAYQLKLDLMKKILQANLELQKRESEGGAA